MSIDVMRILITPRCRVPRSSDLLINTEVRASRRRRLRVYLPPQRVELETWNRSLKHKF